MNKIKRRINNKKQEREMRFRNQSQKIFQGELSIVFMRHLKALGCRITRYKDGGSRLKKKWETSFINISEEKKKEIMLDEYLWHIYSWKEKTCLEKREAEQAFLQHAKGKCFIFFQCDDAYLEIENGENLNLEVLQNEYDVYIVNENFSWTFIKTHEEYFGLGPYFDRN